MADSNKHRWSISHNYLAGITSGDWFRLLADNRFEVSPAYWHRAAFITLASLVNSCFAFVEQLRYRHAIEQSRIARPPLFVLGHWRSGTTWLHYLLAQDENQFKFANTFQVVNPHTFLTTETFATRWFSGLVPEQRPMDNMKLGFTLPQEDEFAPLLMTLQSPYLGISFPRHSDKYLRYLTFRDVPREDVDRWKRAFVLFCQKVCMGEDRTLLLKSPAHTARIRMLLEMFPEARFIHIHRDPYRVFQSQRHFFDTAGWYTYLQTPDTSAIDEGILERYEVMYDAYFEDLPLVSPDRICEVRFDELEADPVAQLRAIYERLSLDAFGLFEPQLCQFAESNKEYRKNDFPRLDDASRNLVAKRWHRSFETWGYAIK